MIDNPNGDAPIEPEATNPRDTVITIEPEAPATGSILFIEKRIADLQEARKIHAAKAAEARKALEAHTAHINTLSGGIAELEHLRDQLQEEVETPEGD